MRQSHLTEKNESLLILGTIMLLGAISTALATSPSSSSGPYLTPQECEAHAANYGQGNSADTYALRACFSAIAGVASPKNTRFTSDKTIEAVGYKNMIIIRQLTPQAAPSPALESIRVIAGSKTGLADVRAIALNENESTVIALNYPAEQGGSPSISTYLWSRNGNMIPIRTTAPVELQGATSIAVDGSKGMIFAANPEQRTITVFSSKADVAGRSPASTTVPLTQIQGSSSQLQHPIDLAVDTLHHVLYSLEGFENEILGYSYSSLGGTTPIFAATFPAATTHPTSLTLSSGLLTVAFSDDTQLSVPAAPTATATGGQ
jgi:hypothetical protein